MKPNPDFVSMPKQFWANVRIISQEVGYTNRGKGSIKVPTITEMCEAFSALHLDSSQLRGLQGEKTELGRSLEAYYRYRADVLDAYVEPRLMSLERVSAEYKKIADSGRHRCPTPMNKQKGEKRNVAFLTAIVNMLIEESIGDAPCDYDPRSLTSVTVGGTPIRTLARRVDGAYPGIVNPIAIWEIKEYYYTTTFGSRVADGVYETLLDGMELEELKESEGIHVHHLLMLDDHYTWWDCGRSYLCRIIDMLHMGYVDEVLFGYEVIEQLPAIARQWRAEYELRRLKK